MDSAPPDAGIASGTQDDQPVTGKGLRFRCKSCGADMTWDPESDALACDHCGARVPVPRKEGLIVERPLEDAGTAARGFGLETRTATCKSCGARVAFESVDTSRTCTFCGAAAVLEESSYRNALRPESLIPLDIGRAKVEAEFRRWIGTLWFRPNALKSTRGFDAIGVYLPFWTFDCDVHSDWSADAGWYYTEQELRPVLVNGKIEMRWVPVQKVRWEPAWGARDDKYDDVLVHASKGVPEKLAQQLGAWEMKSLVPYQPEYLAGWQAEEYAVDLETGWQAAQARVVATQESRCGGDVPGDTQRNLRVHNQVSEVRWKLVLLPLWALTYRFQGKPYTVLIHGQSAKIVGDAPYSWIKIALFVLALLAGVVVLAALLAL